MFSESSLYSNDPAMLLEIDEIQGTRCYDCGHDNDCAGCDKKMKDYPKADRSTCIHWISKIT